jgi:ABC-type sugar transport system substrate-binding protein
MKKYLVWILAVIFASSLAFYSVGCTPEQQEDVQAAIQEAVESAVAEVEVTAAPAETTAAVEEAKEITWKDSEAMPGLQIPTEVPKMKVACVPLFFGHDAHKGMHMKIEQLFDEVGWEYETFNPDTKIDVQLQICEDILSKGDFDIVLLNPCDSGGIIGAIEKFNDAGIPVFLWDRVAYGGKVVWGTTSDSYQAGALLAQSIVDKIAEKYGDPKGEVCAILNNPEVDTHALRIDGMWDVFDRYPEIEVFTGLVPAYDPAASVKVMQDLVVKHPDAVALYSQCSYYATGYIQALDEINRLFTVDDENHLIYGSIDGDPYAHQQVRDGLQDVEVTHAISEWGGVTAWAAVLYAAGAELPAPGYVMSVPGQFWDGSKVVMQKCGPIATLAVAAITPDNVDDPQFWGNQGEMINAYWDTRE